MPALSDGPWFVLRGPDSSCGALVCPDGPCFVPRGADSSPRVRDPSRRAPNPVPRDAAGPLQLGPALARGGSKIFWPPVICLWRHCPNALPPWGHQWLSTPFTVSLSVNSSASYFLSLLTVPLFLRSRRGSRASTSWPTSWRTATPCGTRSCTAASTPASARASSGSSCAGDSPSTAASAGRGVRTVRCCGIQVESTMRTGLVVRTVSSERSRD